MVGDRAVPRNTSRFSPVLLKRHAGEVKGNIDDHLLRAADESAPAGLDEDGPGLPSIHH
jgi:hypothetical protein